MSNLRWCAGSTCCWPKRAQALVFAGFRLERDGVVWRGQASGEPWHAGLSRGVEVKGATLTMLSVRQAAAGWEVRCVVHV